MVTKRVIENKQCRAGRKSHKKTKKYQRVPLENTEGCEINMEISLIKRIISIIFQLSPTLIYLRQPHSKILFSYIIKRCLLHFFQE